MRRSSPIREGFPFLLLLLMLIAPSRTAALRAVRPHSLYDSVLLAGYLVADYFFFLLVLSVADFCVNGERVCGVRAGVCARFRGPPPFSLSLSIAVRRLFPWCWQPLLLVLFIFALWFLSSGSLGHPGRTHGGTRVCASPSIPWRQTHATHTQREGKREKQEAHEMRGPRMACTCRQGACLGCVDAHSCQWLICAASALALLFCFSCFLAQFRQRDVACGATASTPAAASLAAHVAVGRAARRIGPPPIAHEMQNVLCFSQARWQADKVRPALQLHLSRSRHLLALRTTCLLALFSARDAPPRLWPCFSLLGTCARVRR